MPTIAVSLPNDGDNATAATVDTPITTIVNLLNGGLDHDNMVDGGITGAKLAASTVTVDKLAANALTGWLSTTAPNTVTALGNRSYSMVVNGVNLTGILSNGMRLRTTRTVAAPNQCTSLNGTTQYYSKASPNKLAFTNNFVVSAWVKLTSYANGAIASRFDGTSGWRLLITSSGQVNMIGFNAGAANFSQVQSYQSLPLNKWVHVTAQLDMLTFTATTTTSYVMIDGVDVPSAVTRGGTNPTALVQAGNLQIGADNSTDFFPGKISQVAIYSAKVTQATILASMHQTLAGTETSLASAYSFNNLITDLNTTTPNDLTANGSAVATSTDSPFGGQSDGTISTTLDYAIITKTAFSTNTTLTVQVPEGCTIPTSGGVTALAYSTASRPYLMPINQRKWRLQTVNKTNNTTTSNATYGAFLAGGHALNVPIGEWDVGHQAGFNNATTTSVYFAISPTSLTGLSQSAAALVTDMIIRVLSSAASAYVTRGIVKSPQSLSAATTYTMQTFGATTSAGFDGTVESAEIFAEFALL